MQEFLSLLKCTVRKFPRCLGGCQHRECSEHIRSCKYARILDASVNVALGREMNDAVDIIFLKYLIDRFRIADIGFYKCIVGTVLDILKILEITGVCQLVDVDNTDLITVFFEHIMYVIRADETGAACDDICSHIFTS